jgi:hypothetical protein
MSERPHSRLGVALFAVAMGLMAGVLPGQSTNELLARRNALRARADSLNARTTALKAAERDAGLDTVIRVGTLTLRTAAALQGTASAALADAASAARVALGDDADSVGAHLRLSLREQRSSVQQRFSSFFGTSVALTEERVTSIQLEASTDSTGLPGTRLDHPLRRRDLAASILLLYERAAGERLSRGLSIWLNRHLPIVAPPPASATELYRAMATDPSAAVRRCAAGDRAACRLGFALDSMPRDRIAAWYEATDLPALASRAGDGNQRGWMTQRVSRDEQRACVEQGRLEVCRQMLALLPTEAFGIPMPLSARASLTRLALIIGGPSAYARLRTSADSTLGGQLAAAAGVPSDDLVTRWTQQLIAARPASPLPNIAFVLASVACITLCAAWAIRGKPWN